jgi:hypothetical protein
MFLKHLAKKVNEFELVAPTGFGSQASLFEIAFEGLALPRHRGWHIWNRHERDPKWAQVQSRGPGHRHYALRAEVGLPGHGGGASLIMVGAGGGRGGANCSAELMPTWHFCLCPRVSMGRPATAGSRQTGLPGVTIPCRWRAYTTGRAPRVADAVRWRSVSLFLGTFLGTRTIRGSPRRQVA